MKKVHVPEKLRSEMAEAARDAAVSETLKALNELRKQGFGAKPYVPTPPYGGFLPKALAPQARRKP